MDGLVSVSLSWGFLFLTQTSAGILGNSFLFCLYNFYFLTSQSLRSRDVILKQLVLANDLVLFSKGIPHTMAAFGLKAFLDVAGCKLLFYLHRAARGVSISLTSLLSGSQALTLCPDTSRWLESRMRSPKYLGTCCFLCWILSLLVNVNVVMTVSGPKNSKNMSTEKMYRYCFSPVPERLLLLLFSIFFPISDALCMGLMAWASGTMVLFLKRHKKRVQHIHRHSLSCRPSHEDRAIRVILILVSMFASFYSLSAILSGWIVRMVNPSHWLLNVFAFVSFGFSAFSPFVFIFSDTGISKFCFVPWSSKANSPILVPDL